jgi:hypothetical protein
MPHGHNVRTVRTSSSKSCGRSLRNFSSRSWMRWTIPAPIRLSLTARSQPTTPSLSSAQSLHHRPPKTTRCSGSCFSPCGGCDAGPNLLPQGRQGYTGADAPRPGQLIRSRSRSVSEHLSSHSLELNHPSRAYPLHSLGYRKATQSTISFGSPTYLAPSTGAAGSN